MPVTTFWFTIPHQCGKNSPQCANLATAIVVQGSAEKLQCAGVCDFHLQDIKQTIATNDLKAYEGTCQ